MPTTAQHIDPADRAGNALIIRTNSARLNAHDSSVALGFVKLIDLGRNLTPKQDRYLAILAQRALGGTMTPQPAQPLAGDGFARLAALFNTAKQHLKRPRIGVTVNGLAL